VSVPLTVDSSTAAPWDLAALNRAIQDPKFRFPNQPVVVTGQVVSSYKGRHYELVLGLATVDALPGAQDDAQAKPEIILCLFERPVMAPVMQGSVVAVAGLLDRASAPNNLILTTATLAGP
jgi:hypothetical protein